jgi:hypothetical protein
MTRRRANACGVSLLEVVFVAGMLCTAGAVAIPAITAAIDDLRTQGAVRYMAGRAQEARTQAVLRSAHVALRFERQGDTYRYALYADGNEDGVRTQDIQRGIDVRLAPFERLGDQFPGVEFGALPHLPAPDAGSTAPGADAVRMGASDMLVFTAIGTATAGSLYIRGHRDAQYAIRVFGETGKVRILKFEARSRRWRAL